MEPVEDPEECREGTRGDRRVWFAAASTLASVALPGTPLFDMTTTVVSQLIGLGIGLAGGLITGFYFERRAVRQSKELDRQLSALKTTMYSLGAPAEVVDERTLYDDLASEVTARARETQDASGRVRRPDLIAHFVARGDDPGDIEAVISSMSAVGAAKEEGEWLRLP